MSQYKYAFQGFNKELMARAVGRDISASTKQAIEICSFIRNRKLTQAKNLLSAVIEKKQAVPFKRFTNGLGHRPGRIASGRYPIKASKIILGLLESVEANAQTKGLNTGELRIIHICAHKAHSPGHYGRHSGREFKRTHLEVVVKEVADTKKAEKKAPIAKKPETKPAPDTEKTEQKPEHRQHEKKATKAAAHSAEHKGVKGEPEDKK